MNTERTHTFYRRRYESLLTQIREDLSALSSPARQREFLGEFVMPERTNYLALAHSWRTVERWCHTSGVKPTTVRYVLGMQTLRGVGDFSLIVFGGWHDNQTRGYLGAGNYALARAEQLYFPDTHKPVVDERGVITGWERR